MFEVLAEDRQALVTLNGMGSEIYDPFWIWLSETWVWIPLYVIFAYLLYKNLGKRNFLYILLFVALGVTISDQLAGIFKNGMMRLRPCQDPTLKNLIRVVKCGGPFGFYSSHASNTFFLANFLSIMLYRKYRWLPFFVFAWAAAVSYSRIYLGVHFPLDILMGAAVGFLLGGLFATIARNTIVRLDKSRQVNRYDMASPAESDRHGKAAR